MGTLTLEPFFAGKHFIVPKYQRDYAWELPNVDDIFDDILEAIDTGTSHYIGTFILSETDRKGFYNVVDGQQRLTTIILLFNEAIRCFIPKENQNIYIDKFIKSQDSEIWRLELLNDNNVFFQDLLSGKRTSVKTKSQELLYQAFGKIKTRINELKRDTNLSKKFLEALKSLEVLEFIETDDGKAIRMFQTVNDRGKALSNLEKSKSLLIYYSNRFLQGELDDFINTTFGDIFHKYLEIKTIGEKNHIEIINQKRFTEDSIMRYHYLAYAEEFYDYEASESYVLDYYLKYTLKKYQKNEQQLRHFILDYVTDLGEFYNGLLNILYKCKRIPKYYKLFSVLGLSATLYPLIIRLECKGVLDNKCKKYVPLTFLDLLEITDVRVYKIRGTNPRVDIFYLAKDSKTYAEEEIEDNLLAIIEYFMSDAELERRLKSDIYPNQALKFIFMEYSETLNNNRYRIKEIINQTEAEPTVEHIFSQEPRFDFPDYGFENEKLYFESINKIGNLTVLEKNLNSLCQNKIPIEKIRENIYGRSLFEDPKQLGAEMMRRKKAFVASNIEERTKKLVEYCLKRLSYKR